MSRRLADVLCGLAASLAGVGIFLAVIYTVWNVQHGQGGWALVSLLIGIGCVAFISKVLA